MSGRRSRETILLTVDEIGDRYVDLGTTSSVLALARELNGSDESSYLSLYVHRLARTLSPSLNVLSTDIRSGDVVRVVLAEPEVGSFLTSEDATDSPAEIEGATLHMLSGPLTGSAYQLSVGDNRVGRVSDNDVVLVDAGVSRHHATISVSPDGVLITDNQSTNGIRVDGKAIGEPTAVQSGQRVLLGRCWVAITFAAVTRPDEVTERERARETLRLTKGERQYERFAGQLINLPAPPTTGGRRRRSNAGSDQIAVDQFNIAVGAMVQRLDDLQQTEGEVRRAEFPSIDVLAANAFVDGRPNPSLLWQREAADVDGLDVRLGLATQLSRTQVALPPGGDSELRAKVVEIPERYRSVPNVPAVINFRQVGSVGVFGSTDAALTLTRSMIGQLVATHGPDQLGLLYRPGGEAREWDWLKWLPHTCLTGSRSGVPEAEFVSVVSKLLNGQPTTRTGRARPPAVVALIDDPGALPPALFPRLVQEGPDVGVYPVLLGGDAFPFDVAPEAMIRVGVESANLTMPDGSHLGGITIERADRSVVASMARQLASVEYEHGPSLEPAITDVEPSSEEVIVGRFELGGATPPYWPSEEPAVAEPEVDAVTFVETHAGSASDPEPEPEPQPPAEQSAEAEPSTDSEMAAAAEHSGEPLPGEAVSPVATGEVGPVVDGATAEADPMADAVVEAVAVAETDPEVAPEPEAAGELLVAEEDPPAAEAEPDQVAEAVEQVPAHEGGPAPDQTPVAANVAEAEVVPPTEGEPAEALEVAPEVEPEPPADSEPEVAGVAGQDPEVGLGEAPEAEAAAEVEPEPVAQSEPTEELGPEPEPEPALESQPQAKPEPKLLLAALPPAEGDARLILGTVQVPGRANPAVFAMNLPRDGSLGLVGPSGSGRTWALQTVAAATALLTVDPDDIPIVYYLDVPGELQSLRALPNAIGATKNDIDGFRAVTADLGQLLVDRRAAFDELGAANLDEYRHLQPGARLRRIVTLIDNIEAYAELMEAIDPARLQPLMAGLLEHGPALGVHLVFTGNGHGDLPPQLGSSVGRWLTLGGGGADGLVRPGRAMVGQNEVRFAVVAQAEPAAAIHGIGTKLLASGATPLTNPSGPVQAAG